jgi:nuclear transport factor 2 (NTF2) superfamily protein
MPFLSRVSFTKFGEKLFSAKTRYRLYVDLWAFDGNYIQYGTYFS